MRLHNGRFWTDMSKSHARAALRLRPGWYPRDGRAVANPDRRQLDRWRLRHRQTDAPRRPHGLQHLSRPAHVRPPDAGNAGRPGRTIRFVSRRPIGTGRGVRDPRKGGGRTRCGGGDALHHRAVHQRRAGLDAAGVREPAPGRRHPLGRRHRPADCQRWQLPLAVDRRRILLWDRALLAEYIRPRSVASEQVAAAESGRYEELPPALNVAVLNAPAQSPTSVSSAFKQASYEVRPNLGRLVALAKWNNDYEIRAATFARSNQENYSFSMANGTLQGEPGGGTLLTLQYRPIKRSMCSTADRTWSRGSFCGSQDARSRTGSVERSSPSTGSTTDRDERSIERPQAEKRFAATRGHQGQDH